VKEHGRSSSDGWCQGFRTEYVPEPSSRSSLDKAVILATGLAEKNLVPALSSLLPQLLSMASTEAPMARPQGPPLVRRVAPAAVEEPPVGDRRLPPEEVDVALGLRQVCVDPVILSSLHRLLACFPTSLLTPAPILPLLIPSGSTVSGRLSG
jgi:hypothetical protein